MTPVLDFAVAAVALALAAAVLHGWGAALLGAARLARPAPPVAIALGLAVVLVLGGVLNLARLAHAPALALVLVAGVLLFVRDARRGRLTLPAAKLVPAAALIATAVGFAIATQLPPAFFNYHDDFEKYFAHPVRMLATGTLFDGPLSALGSETLGGMAFLHAFVVMVLPIQYVNGVDAVLGLGLLLALGAGAGRYWHWPLGGAVLTVVAIACLDPAYVNVSALYLGAALMAACAMVSADAPDGAAPPLVLGLLYAALVALKPTFVVFGAWHGLLTGVAIGVTRGPREGVAWALRTALWACAALLPWLALHAPHYLSAPVAHLPVPPASDEAREAAAGHLLEVSGPYRAVAALGLLAAVAGALALRDPGMVRRRAAGASASALACILAPFTLVVVFGGWLSEPATNLRYAVPFFLVVPAIAALVLPLSWPGSPRVRQGFGALALLALALEGLPAALQRYGQQVESRSAIGFLPAEDAGRSEYRDYVRDALSETAAREIAALQARVPAGEPVLAWITLPFHLDYARNPIRDVEPAGLATWWARVPADVRYVIWQHSGPTVRGPGHYLFDSPGRRDRVQAVRATAFVEWLRRERAAGEMLYEDERFAVFRLRAAQVN